jgi:flagellar hook assembly protein FlgD
VNYPNPFQAGRESTSLEFAASAGSDLSLEIFNMMGQKVYGRDFVIGEPGTIPNTDGVIRVFWDGRNNDGVTVANGGYVAIMKVKADGRTFKRKIAVVK